MKKYLTILKQFLRFKRPDNLKVVAYCILTAATFWFFSALNKEYDTSVNYPVKWTFDNEKFIIIEELPKEVQLNVSGLGWHLLKVNSGIGLEPINLRLTDPSSQKVLPANYFANQLDEALEQLRLNYIIQDSLHFNIDYRINQSFPVYIDSLHIDLDEDYRIVSHVRFDTELINIEGPKTLILSMPKDTFWVNIIETNIDSDFDNEVPIELPFPELMNASPQTVKITFEVAKFIEQEIEVPISYENTEPYNEIYVKDSVISIHYLVQEGLSDSVSINLFNVRANFNDINKADSTLMLRMEAASSFIIDPYLAFPQVKVYYNE